MTEAKKLRLRTNGAGRKPKAPTLSEEELQPLKARFEGQYERLYGHYQAIDQAMPEIYKSIAELYNANLSQKAIADVVGSGQQWVSTCIAKARDAGLVVVDDKPVMTQKSSSNGRKRVVRKPAKKEDRVPAGV